MRYNYHDIKVFNTVLADLIDMDAPVVMQSVRSYLDHKRYRPVPSDRKIIRAINIVGTPTMRSARCDARRLIKEELKLL